MLLNFNYQLNVFRLAQTELLQLLSEKLPNELVVRARFEACSSDVIGSASAAIDAYMAYLPWFLDQQIEHDFLFSASSFETLDEIVKIGQKADDQRTDSERQRYDNHFTKQMEQLEVYNKRQTLRDKYGVENQRIESEFRLVSTFKSFLFFTRALQDSFYEVATCFSGNSIGPNSSMNNIHKSGKLKSHGPAVDVVKEIPNYIEWFIKIRNLRNEVKKGIESGPAGSLGDFGIGFSRVSNSGNKTINVQEILSLSEVATSLEISTKFQVELLKMYKT